MAVRTPAWIAKEIRLVGIRVNGVFREEHWLVAREWERDDFVKADAGAKERAIDAAHQTDAVGLVGAFPKSGLFHGAAKFAHACKFSDIVHAAAEFPFWPSAAREDQGGGSDSADCSQLHSFPWQRLRRRKRL